MLMRPFDAFDKAYGVMFRVASSSPIRIRISIGYESLSFIGNCQRREFPLLTFPPQVIIFPASGIPPTDVEKRQPELPRRRPTDAQIQTAEAARTVQST